MGSHPLSGVHRIGTTPRLGVDGRFWVGSTLYWLGDTYLAHRLGMTLENLASRIGTLPASSEIVTRMAQRFAPPAAPFASA